MILTDGVHLVSSGLGRAGKDELHDFADSIGLNRCWYRRGHYDLGISKAFRAEMLRRALAAGAQEAAPRTCARYRRRTMTGIDFTLTSLWSLFEKGAKDAR